MANKHSVYQTILLTVFLLCDSTAVLAESSEEKITLPGSEKSYTEKEINNFFEVPDWYPEKHIPMPTVVSHGAKPKVFACASCHLTSGSGHPESSALAGLPVEYQIRQMKAYQKFQRNSVIGVMNTIARAMTNEQIRDSAEYFAALPALDVQEVREAIDVPLTYVNKRFMLLELESGSDKKEKIGERIIMLPVDENRVKARDPYATFITYVPEGSLLTGKKLVNEGKGNAAACTSCHGADLKGTSVAPLIAGQHASYLRAQLRDYKAGIRRGEADPGKIMATNMKYFTDWEILATAAYIASLPRQ
ncbi:MAG: c-type cytochrome [Gammaproteobacteria bacterium]|nr:c-type cytochrome [Gammaproteobacteria bacterium]